MKKLALFFTYGVSLQDWQSSGSLPREARLYRALQQEFPHIFFLTYGPADAALQQTLPAGIYVLPKKYPRMPNWLYSLVLPVAYRAQLRSATWLKTNQMLGSWPAVLAKLLYRKPLFVRTGFLPSRFANFANETVWKRAAITIIEWLGFLVADRISVASPADAERTKAIVLPNSVDTTVFKPASGLIPANSFRLLFVGRLVPQKNCMALLEAIVGLPGIALTIVGRGPQEKLLRHYAAAHHIQLSYVPSVPNDQLPGYYQATDLYVQPSLFEGHPKTILEAMSCGAPVLSTQVPGVKEVIRHDVDGYLCDVTADSLRQAILYLRHNPAIRQALGRRARRTVEQHYSFAAMIQKELSLYASDH